MRAAVFLVMLLSACSGYDDLALLEVDTIEPPEIEPGGDASDSRSAAFPLDARPTSCCVARSIARGCAQAPWMRASPATCSPSR